MLALSFALDDESIKTRKLLEKSNFCRVSNIDVYTHTLGDNIFYLFHTGVGKANAASSLSKMISFFNVDHVLNIGVAGGIGHNIKQGDLILADQVAYFDVDLTFFNYKFGQLPDLPITFGCKNALTEACATILTNQNELRLVKGLIASGDSFVTKNNYEEILKRFPNCQAVDMEAASLAQVCYENKIHFTSLKVISDLPAQGFESKLYDNFVDKVTTKMAKFIPEILKYYFYTKRGSLI